MVFVFQKEIVAQKAAVAQAHRDDWRLAPLWNFAREPRAFELRPPPKAQVSLMATGYQASLL